MPGLIDEAIERLKAKSPEARIALLKDAKLVTRKMAWVPNPGPQTEAYFSLADVLLYGGEPGGGKSQLVAGLAYNEHQRSLIMRRQYGELNRIVDDVLRIHGSRDGFNGSPPPKLRISADKMIEFGAAHRIGDEQGRQGQGVDFLGLDEATHFAEIQVRTLMGWVRTDQPGQRTRTVLATNPPLTADGLWVNIMFEPWLNPAYHKPAKPGELRWAVSDEDGKIKWVDGPGAWPIADKMYEAKSYTYIPASVKDNPHYANSGYQRELDSMPEPFRSILMGGFRTTFRDQDGQIIPTAWIRAAIARWNQWGGKPPPGVPMCAICADCTGGGADPLVIGMRYDGWYDEFEVVPGREIPMEKIGRTTAGHIVAHRRDRAVIIVDMGGGYGGPAYEHLHMNFEDDPIKQTVIGFKGSEATTKRTHDGKYGFANQRTMALWKMREALDPDQVGGSQIMLPDDAEMVADLAAVTFEIKGSTIHAEPKDKVCARIGRSTDRGDVVCMAWTGGATASTDGAIWDEERKSRPRYAAGRRPVVIKPTRDRR